MMGSILTCVGLGIVLRPILNIEPVEIMPLVIGIAFVIDYVFSFDYGNRWGLYFGVSMCIYAFKNAIPMDSTVNLISAVVLIGVGISVIFKALKNER